MATKSPALLWPCGRVKRPPRRFEEDEEGLHSDEEPDEAEVGRWQWHRGSGWRRADGVRAEAIDAVLRGSRLFRMGVSA